MTQEERTQLIREIKELLILNKNDKGGTFDSETKKLLLTLLNKMLVMSLI